MTSTLHVVIMTKSFPDVSCLASQVLGILKQLPDLRCLYLKGNPVVSNIRHYRKVVIAAIPTLTYLDDRPIFDTERRCAEAW